MSTTSTGANLAPPCERCGEALPWEASTSRLYCGRSCRDGAARARRLAARAARPVACGHCRAVLPATMRAGARYCSRRCAKRAWRAGPMPRP